MRAPLTVRVVTAFGADQLVIDAAGHQPLFAEDDVRLAETIDAGGAFAAIAGFATFVAIDAFDRHIIRWTGDAAMLIFRTDGDARVHAHVAEFAWAFTQQRLAGPGVAAPGAGIAILVSAALLARAVAAEQAGGTIGRAGAAIGWVFLQIDTFAVTAGEALATITSQTGATEPNIDTDAVAALLRLGVATIGAADDAGRLACPLGIAIGALRAVGRATTLGAMRRRNGLRTADLFTFAGRNAFAADAGFAWIADDRLADATNARRACIAIGKTGTTLRGRNANAIAAFFLSCIAARVVARAAGEFERFAAHPRALVTLARRATGRVAAAVVRIGTTFVIAEDFPLWTLRGNLVQTGGGRTSQNGAPEKDLECPAARKPSGE